MTNKNRTLLSLAVIVVIGGIVTFASNTETFKGLMRKSQAPQQTEKTDKKWWCTKSPMEEESITTPEEESGNGGNGETPNNQEENNTSTQEPEENQSTQTEENKNSIVLIDPEVMKTIRANNLSRIGKIFSKQNTIALDPKIPNDNNKDKTPEPINPPGGAKNPIVISVECSCDADYIFIEEVNDKFPCKEPNTKDTYHYEANQKFYNITITKPAQGLCQKGLKENEENEIYLGCGCNQDRIYSQETKKVYDCPPQNSEPALKIKEGNTIVFVDKPSVFECSAEWKCPSGYYQDYSKMEATCNSFKKAECEGGKIEPKFQLKEICDVAYETIMKAECQSVQ